MLTTSTTKEDKRSMVASSVAASTTRKRNDGFIHGKPLVMRICFKTLDHIVDRACLFVYFNRQ